MRQRLIGLYRGVAMVVMLALLLVGAVVVGIVRGLSSEIKK